MIHSLTGRITGKLEGHLLLSSGPVEWTLTVSNSTLSSLPEVGETCRVLTYLHHREDQFYLVGFADESERELFSDLIGVSGIGPKQAVKILSGMNAKLLTEAITQEDLLTLSKIPGLGKKTAQKIILALKGTLVDQQKESSGHMETNDLIEALVQMGYDRQQVRRALQEVTSRADTAGMDTALREAHLMKEAIRLLS